MQYKKDESIPNGFTVLMYQCCSFEREALVIYDSWDLIFENRAPESV